MLKELTIAKQAMGFRGSSLLSRLLDDYESKDEQDIDRELNIKYVASQIFGGESISSPSRAGCILMVLLLAAAIETVR